MLSFGLVSLSDRLSTKLDDGCFKLTYCQFSNTNRKTSSISQSPKGDSSWIQWFVPPSLTLARGIVYFFIFLEEISVQEEVKFY